MFVVIILSQSKLLFDLTVNSLTVLQGADLVDGDAKKRNNGPGSYDVMRSYDYNSEYVSRKGFRFGGAPRQSLAMKTPSPG